MKRMFARVAAFLAIFALSATAAEITSEDARALFKRWAGSGVRLGSNFSADISDVSGHLAGTNRFFSVKLKDGKTVILSGDSSAKNPVIAFSTSGDMPLDEGSPLVALLEKDLEARLKTASSVKSATDTTLPITEHSIDDMRVKPFVMTKWGQSTTISGSHCFDYYTPTAKLNGKETRTVCGCVATAMSQLMRYWQWPSADFPVGQASVECQVPRDSTTPDNNPRKSETLTMQGGTYSWEKMDYVPKTNDETCRAIGKLTSDCGIAVGMMYNFREFGGSGAYMSDVCPALKDNFHYTKAVMTRASDLSNRSDFTVRAKAILSNLDAKMPVLLGVSGKSGGHAIVADGYGFSGDVETPYIHLNMGWNGQDDIWYNLPDINIHPDNPERFTSFDVLDEACYNIFPTNDLEIVSGRIFDLDGTPVNDVKVYAYAAGGESGSDEAGIIAESRSSEFGVYALAVPGGAAYFIRAETEDGSAVGEIETTTVGTSSSAKIGNLWGVNLEIGEPCLRIGGAVFASFQAAMREVARLASEGVERPLVEILAPVTLDETISIGNDCIIATTNEVPGETAITLLGGATINIGGQKSGSAEYICPEVCFSNVVFRSPSADFPPTLTVSAGSKLRLAAATEIDTVRLVEKSGYESRFVLDGFEPSPVIVEWSGKSERGAVFANAENMDGDALAAAARLLSNALDDGVGGAVDALNPDGSYSIVWQEAPCPAECAFAKSVPVSGGGAATNCYRSLDALLKDLSGDAEIILMRNCTLSNGVSVVTNSIRISSADDAIWPAPFKVVMEKGAAFAIPEGGRIEANNVAFRRKQEGQVGTNTRFVIDGGVFVLGSQASISGFKETVKGNVTNGVVYVSKGVFRMESGSSMTECGSSGKGGAVYLADTQDAVFDFSGGEILNCYAASDNGGGAVYACANSRITVSGDAVAEGNTAGAQNRIKESDIEFASAKTSMLRVGSTLSGKVGVRYGTKSSNNAGGVCAELADSSYGEDPGTLRAIFSPIGPNTLEAVVCETNASLLAWRTVDTSAIPTVADGVDADAILIVNGVTNRYEYLEYAFAAVGSNQMGRIVLLRDCYMTNILSGTLYTDVSGAVTLDGDGYRVYRRDSRTIKIPAESSLDLTNVVFDASDDLTYEDMPEDKVSSLFWAEGGNLLFGDKTLVTGVTGSKSRAAAAVVVEKKGFFTMESGAEISSCTNFYVNVSEGTGVGAGILADTATVRLKGGTITNCAAYKCGGVCLANKSVAEISGDVAITGNTNLEGEECNLVYQARDCGVVLAGAMDGKVGVVEGYMTDTNVFGNVDGAYLLSADEEEIIVSASNFVHDVRGATGLVATNDAVAILVWSDACDVSTKTYTDGEGVEYFVLGEVPPQPDQPDPPTPPDPPAPTPVPCQPFTFTSIVETAEGKWRLTLAPGVGYCTYSLYASDVPLSATSVGVDAAWGAPVAVTNLVTDGDFTFEVESSAAKKFWAVKGEDGEK